MARPLLHRYLASVLRPTLLSLCLAGTLALAGIVALAAKTGVSDAYRYSGGSGYEVAFLAIVSGVALGAARSARLAQLLWPCSTSTKLALQAVALGVPALVLLIITLLPAAFAATERRDLAVGASLAIVHSVALGLLLVSVPTAPTATAILLVVALLLVPSLLPSASAARALLDAGSHMLPGPSARCEAAAPPILALFLLAAALSGIRTSR